MLDDQLAKHPFLTGERFTAADAYLSWFFVLSEKAQLDHSSYPSLEAYRQTVLARPALRELIESDRKF